MQMEQLLEALLQKAFRFQGEVQVLVHLEIQHLLLLKMREQIQVQLIQHHQMNQD